MFLKKNIKLGKLKFNILFIVLILSFTNNLSISDDLEGNFTNIKILDKISSKNILIKLENGENKKYKDF